MNIIFKSMIVSATAASLFAFTAPSAHATNQTSCVDGNVRSNLTVTWKNSKNVTVGTVNNKPLCDDVTLFFSSYTMPGTYNGKPFSNNPTASPQTIFDNTSVVLKKGSVHPSAMSIALPEACKNIQGDVYYAPEIKIVDAKGHGKQYISGKILTKTTDKCTPVAPEQTPPVVTPLPIVPTPEAQIVETPAPEVVISPTVTPAELPRTGVSSASLATLGSILSVITYAVAYRLNKH